MFVKNNNNGATPVRDHVTGKCINLPAGKVTEVPADLEHLLSEEELKERNLEKMESLNDVAEEKEDVKEEKAAPAKKGGKKEQLESINEG